MDRQELKKDGFSTLAIIEKYISSVKDKSKKKKERKIKLFYNER